MRHDGVVLGLTEVPGDLFRVLGLFPQEADECNDGHDGVENDEEESIENGGVPRPPVPVHGQEVDRRNDAGQPVDRQGQEPIGLCAK